jgi:hypothetical protein
MRALSLLTQHRHPQSQSVINKQTHQRALIDSVVITITRIASQ